MSSLRLALKQSLAETGHLAIHDKTNRKHSSSRDPARRRKTNKRKASSSNKSKRKKLHTTSLAEQNVKKESISEISASDCASFPTTIDTNGDTNMSVRAAASDDGNSISSDEGSSFSDSDTGTNASSCYSHRLNQRIYSSEDKDSSEEMHEDMKGVFEMDGTSADESQDPKTSSNPMSMAQNLDSKQQQHSHSHGENLVNQQQQSPHKKKKRKRKRKRKDKAKRKKDRIKQSSVKGEDQESLGYGDENDYQQSIHFL